MTKIILLVISVLGLTLFGCNVKSDQSEKPFHTVCNTDNMIIYHVTYISSTLNEYWVTDGSNMGWTLRSDKKYNVGDKLVISLKPNTPQ